MGEKMAFLDKLKFWKKREPFEKGIDLGLPPPDAPFAQQPTPLSHPTPEISPFPEMGSEQSQMYAQYPPYVPVSEQRQQFMQYPQQQPQQAQQLKQVQYPSAVEKDIEVVSAKLDSIRATLESINQRLLNIERIAYEHRKREW